MSVVEAFGNVADILAEMAPSKIVEMQSSKAMSKRVEDLASKKRAGTITNEEAIELERYLALDLLITLAKARAKRILAA